MRVILCCLSAACAVLSISIPTEASSVSGPFTVMVSKFPETYYVITGTSGVKYDLLQHASWTSDQAQANALATNLITINSAVQNGTVMADVAQDFSSSVPTLNLSAIPLWIGLNDKSHDPLFGGTDDGPGGTTSTHAANFVWADASAASYRNWPSPGEPSDFDPGPGGVLSSHEYYAAMNWFYAAGSGPYGQWNDTPNAGTIGYVGNVGGSNGYYGIALASVPEPTAFAILGLTSLAILSRRHR